MFERLRRISWIYGHSTDRILNLPGRLFRFKNGQFLLLIALVQVDAEASRTLQFRPVAGAIDTLMLCADTADQYQLTCEGLAGAVKPNRGIVHSDCLGAGKIFDRFLSQIDPFYRFPIFALQACHQICDAHTALLLQLGHIRIRSFRRIALMSMIARRTSAIVVD